MTVVAAAVSCYDIIVFWRLCLCSCATDVHVTARMSRHCGNSRVVTVRRWRAACRRSYVQTPQLLLRHHWRERRPVVGEQHVVRPHARGFQPTQHQPLERREMRVHAVPGRVLPFPPGQQYHVLGVVAGRPGARGHLRGQLVHRRLAQPLAVVRRGHVHRGVNRPIAVVRPHVHLVHLVAAQVDFSHLQVPERRLVRQQERFAPHEALQQARRQTCYFLYNPSA